MTFMPLQLKYLTKEMIEKAETELGETPERRKEAIEEMRNCVTEEKKLYCPTDDSYLLQFLRARKFNVKRAMLLLQNYYQTKKNEKDIFAKTDIEILKKTARDKCIGVLPYRDKDGCFIVLVQLGNWNVHEMSFASLIHSATIAIMLCIDLYPASQIYGGKLLLDAKGTGFKHIWRIPPKHLFVIARGASNSFPVRAKAVHVVGETFLIQHLWHFGKMFLSDKIKKRVFFHSTDQKSLHKEIDPDILPEELGGKLKYDYSFWLKHLDETEETYRKLMSYGYKSRKISKQESV